jgi:hypothetical protein
MGAGLQTTKNASFPVPVGQASKGVFMDKYGMTVIDLTNIGYRDEPFVWAKDVVQVIYAKDLANEGKHVVLQGKKNIIGVENMTEEEGKGF